MTTSGYGSVRLTFDPVNGTITGQWALNNLSFHYEVAGHVEQALRLGMRIADLRPEMIPSRLYSLAVHSDDVTLD